MKSGRELTVHVNSPVSGLNFLSGIQNDPRLIWFSAKRPPIKNSQNFSEISDFARQHEFSPFCRYVLKSGGENRFDVQFDSGLITVERSLDDVTDSKVFKLTVEARDNGSPRLRTQVDVQIKVVDKETPIFGQVSYHKVLSEDSRIGTLIADVHATSPGGADIFYAITQGNPFNQFAIDLRTGECRLLFCLTLATPPLVTITGIRRPCQHYPSSVAVQQLSEASSDRFPMCSSSIVFSIMGL